MEEDVLKLQVVVACRLVEDLDFFLFQILHIEYTFNVFFLKQFTIKFARNEKRLIYPESERIRLCNKTVI